MISGCMYSQNNEKYIRQGDWEKVFTNIAININNDSSDSITESKNLSIKYPEIVKYSDLLFSEQNIYSFADTDENIEYLQFRLKAYCSISTTEKCKTSLKNISQAKKTIKKRVTVPKDLYAQLTPKEQKNLTDTYKLTFYEPYEIGVVTDRQVQNLSTPGSNAGAEIGGAVGATAYINNATPSSYSMKSDLTSTALGALAGAILLNKSPTEQYLIRYTLKLRNGEIMQVDQVSSSPLGQGIGICVFASNASPIDQSFCNMTLAEFKVKFSKEIKNESN